MIAPAVYWRRLVVTIIIVGLLFAVLMWRSYLRAREMESWPRVEAVVLSSGVAERRVGDSGPREFRFEVLYGYEWEGQRRSSGRWTLRGSPWSSKPGKAGQLAAEFPTGATVTCSVSPDDPGLAVLKVDSRGPGYSLWFPLLFVAGGIGIVVGAWVR